jgi:hypothetical protein
MMRRMGILQWASQNWFFLLQGAGIIGGLLFTGLALRMDAKERRNSNTLTIAQEHRELWANFYKRPEWSRVLDPKADLASQPVTHKEEMFILQLVVHLNTALEVLKPGKFAPTDEALRQDIRWFFSLPIPEAIWNLAKTRQDSGFVRFVQDCLNCK